MTTPRWGHKPPAVDNPEDYWGSAPPEPSVRMIYWARRWRNCEWSPNRYLLRECSDCRSRMLGIWIWEANHALQAIAMLHEGIYDHDKIVDRLMSWCAGSGEQLVSYWNALEYASRPTSFDRRDDDLFGLLANSIEERW